jgi:hypothetical protein
VIPSANLVEFDWNLIENSVFYQDFELATEKAEDGEFIFSLKSLLQKMGCPAQVTSALSGYDYTKALGHLVYSIPGNHENSHLYGQGRLNSIVERLNIDFEEPLVTSQVYQH